METSNRFISLDVFRGATIAAMILVNNPGSWDYVYPQLRHAEWHGWTFTDWIFPFFLFIMGVAIAFSFPKRIQKGQSKGQLLFHALRRSLILFFLGLLINGFPFGLIPGHEFSLATWRIPGILQRIALCYLAVSFIFLFSDKRQMVIWIFGLLSGYWLLVRFVPISGFASGTLDPLGNLCWFIDSRLLVGHTWEFAPVPGFDPEGILSTIPAIASTLTGILCGQWLLSSRSNEEKTIWMFITGHGSLLLGILLNNWFPINKNLWSSSYVIFMTGWALICLAIIFWLVDVKGYQKLSKPFVILGLNAILIFTFSELLAMILWVISWKTPDGTSISMHDYLYEHYFESWIDPINASLLFAIVFVMLMYFQAWLLYKRGWFLKI